ncbi:MAG: beta-galactosidase [Planctomycetota bacterium]
MAAITSDGHAFTVDGRRIWLVSGTVRATSTPAAQWPALLAAAKQAGLNTVEVPLVWAHHEPAQGTFDFATDRDVAVFVAMADDADLRVVLRLGPFIGEGHDFGGLPAWMIPVCEGRVRSTHPEFLARVSALFTAYGQQLRKLQATGAFSSTGPIVGVQIEHEFFCEDDALGADYLGALFRFTREAGFNVPILTRNNHFASAEGAIDTWSGATDLHALTRQLRAVDDTNPRIVQGLLSGANDAWGHPPRSHREPNDVVRSIAEALSAGGQINLATFAPGLRTGFDGGRLEGAPDLFAASTPDASAAIQPSGERSDMYRAVRRITTFASSFERVFANLDPDQLPAMIAPSELAPTILDEHTGRAAPRRPSAGARLGAVHATGAQGQVVFVFAEHAAKGRLRTAILLPDGSDVPVEIGDLPVGWVLIDAHLGGRRRLDVCSLNAFALVGDVLVLFGPPGAESLISINGSSFEPTVPKGKTPLIETHEGVTVAIVNEEHIDTVLPLTDRVLFHVERVEFDGTVIGTSDAFALLRSGERADVEAESPKRAPSPPAIEAWSRAPLDGWADGTSDRYALIEGPSSLERLGAPQGYAWFRVRFKASATKRSKLTLDESADRASLFLDGEPIGVVGLGPGATVEVPARSIKKGERTLVALVDNLGRDAHGSDAAAPKGLFGHVYVPAPVKGTPALEEGDPIEPLEKFAPVFGLHTGDMTDARRLTWTVTHRRKSPLVLRVRDLPCSAVIVVNGEPIRLIEPHSARTVLLDSEALTRGKNVIQVAVVGDATEFEKPVREACMLYEGAESVTDGGQWAFGRWEMPDDRSFEEVAKSTLTGSKAAEFTGRPCWWRCAFTPRRTMRALYADLSGLSKGQLFLNGTNICRYFVQTAEREAVPPMVKYLLPGSLLKPGEANTLMLFDEHGFAPTKAKLTYAAP